MHVPCDVEYKILSCSSCSSFCKQSAECPDFTEKIQIEEKKVVGEIEKIQIIVKNGFSDMSGNFHPVYFGLVSHEKEEEFILVFRVIHLAL